MTPEFKAVAESVTPDLPLSSDIVVAATRFGTGGQTVAAKIFAAVVDLERRVIALEADS